MADPGSRQHEDHPLPAGKLFAIGRPIALGVVMIGAGVVNFVGLNRSATPLCVGAIRPVFIG
jgi:hypothetical protein